jgi:hypothetical protein
VAACYSGRLSAKTFFPVPEKSRTFPAREALCGHLRQLREPPFSIALRAPLPVSLPLPKARNRHPAPTDKLVDAKFLS